MTQYPRRLISTSIALALTVAALAVPASVGATSGPYLVKNINATGGSKPEQLTALGNLVLFTANDGLHGRELWRSDGTNAGTQLVKDINPENDNYEGPWGLKAIGGLLYFSATDGVHGLELWASDGTSGNTRMVKDILPGIHGSEPHGFTEYNGRTYFSATTLETGTELWVSDGTAAGTHIVQDIAPGTARTNPVELTVANGKLYFLRVTYVSGWDHAVLYRTNGSSTGALPVKDHNGNKVRGFKRNYNHALWSVGGILYFTVTRKDLWVSRGTRTSTRQIASFGTRRIVDVAGNALVDWFDSATYGPESTLWKSNGTVAGTVPLHYYDSSPIGGSGYADSWLVSIGSNAFFWDSYGGMSVTDGTDAGTRALGVGVWPRDDFSYDEVMVSIKGVLYFDGYTYDPDGSPSFPALWRSDGTTNGTYAASPTYATGMINELTVLGDSILFVNQANGKGSELWRYNP